MTAEPAEPAEPSPPGTTTTGGSGPATTGGLASATTGGFGSATTGGFEPPPLERHHADPHPTGKKLAILSLTALGVVYGDIGTSPLYAIKECFNPAFRISPTGPNVYGVLSLIVWALTLIVSVKYIVYVLRADNRGEGGILALLALLQQRLHRQTDARLASLLAVLGLFGAALLFGEGTITPAMSVLSAIEGLQVATPVFDRFIVPLTVVILFTLFSFQRHGADRIGRFFGPVMCVWFLTIATYGAIEIAREPEILKAINPWYGVRFFANNGMAGFLILGAVVLAVTGAEALYADMGHFGRGPIRVAWFALVFPALLINYFGQGALLLRDSSASENPFYRLVPLPHLLLYPTVILATSAAVIASQALISGAFSLIQQALQLGYSPRVTIKHTSKHEAGQIFIPEVNSALKWGCIALVIGFGSSSGLAAAYGIAVTGTMVITTILFDVIARQRFGWSWHRTILFLMIFLIIDVAFLVANLVKIRSGGWVPIVAALVIYTMMTTWKQGRLLLRRILREASLPLDLFLSDVRRRTPPRVPGTAVFMTSEPSGAPVVLLHHLKHNKMLHEQVLILSVQTEDVPEVPLAERATVEPLGEGFYRVEAKYGFMQTPSMREIMQRCEASGIKARLSNTSFYLGRERLIPRKDPPKARRGLLTRDTTASEAARAAGAGDTGEPPRPRMRLWRKKLFAIMSRNARSATEYFGIPPNRAVELGAQIEF